VLYLNQNWEAVRCIWAEARGEPFDGKVAVGEVIRRRTALRYFSDGTFANTVWWPAQFSWTLDHRIIRQAMFIDDSNPVVLECAQAWANSEDSNLIPNAILYVNLSEATPDWLDKVVEVGKINNHTFFSLPHQNAQA
jgi:N-acetylmuramoyl-L-alanine amidase